MSASGGRSRQIVTRVLRTLGSLWLAAAVMTVLAVAMGWATFLEREMGTPAAQYIVYASGWFYCLIGVLAANIFVAALLRVPALFYRAEPVPADGQAPAPRGKLRVNKRLIPFFLAHLGVLLLIFGCLATARFSTKARATVPETSATETAVATDARVFQIELSGADGEPRKLEIPFSGGPLNWRDFESAKNWNDDVAKPLLDLKPENNFFQKMAKGASKVSQKLAYRCAKLARAAKPGVLYDADGLKLEVLDYATMADLAPVRPLKATLRVRQEDGSTKEENAELSFAFDMSGAGDPLATSRRGQRATLPNGTRLVYMIADSSQDMAAFLAETPNKSEDEPPEPMQTQSVERGNDYLILVIDGVRYQKNVADLALLSRYGALDDQLETFEFQREEVARRLKLEEERTDVEPENRDGAKPLATVTRESIELNAQELQKLSEKLTALADAATDAEANPDAAKEFSDARREFARKRIENYLATTWSQLETTVETSKEFRETLQKMQEQNDLRIADVKVLQTATKLGDSGWTVEAFETSPTMAPNVEELYGWSASVRLRSPQGETRDMALFSELFERNRYPEDGRVFGALWIERPSGDDNEYGRPWNANLGKPKLEFMQDLAGKLAWRCSDGRNRVASGYCSVKADDATVGASETEPVPVPAGEGTPAPGDIESFTLTEFQLQDEIGARVTPTAFVKDQANEFYGKVKIRVTLDDAVETFQLRSLPLESVDESQRAYFDRRIVSSKRAATIRLTDRLIDLGAALYVKKFSAVYEPGSSTAASFSSLTRILPKGMTRDEQRKAALNEPEKDVLIQMNRPGTLRVEGARKVYWAYQDSFRGPFKPGDKEFDSVVEGKLVPGETKPREAVYQTVVTLNDDPGRGMKYLGCLLTVAGTALLVYRRRKGGRAGKAQNSQGTPDMPANAPNAKTTAAVTALLAAVSLLALFTASANADEIIPPEETAAAKANSAPAANGRLDWSSWRLMPVYDGGRRQPLNTFAEILVRDTTGSNAPTVVLPDEVLEKLESGKPLNFPSLEEFLKDVEKTGEPPKEGEDPAAKRAEREKWYKEVAGQAVARQEETARRLRQVFPNGKRKFGAAELLFSWIVEPELWEYVPFIADPKGAVGRDVLAKSAEECARAGCRLAPADFDALDPDGKLRVDSYRAKARADASKAKTVKALDKFEDRLSAYRSVTFIPTQSTSTRPLFYLNRILYGDSTMGMPAFHQGTQSALTKLESAAGDAERLIAREKRALRKSSPFNDKDYILRRKTPLAGEDKSRETLMLARQIAMLQQLYQRYPIASSGILFEKLLVSLTDALDELKAHRDETVAKELFSVAYRQAVQRCVSALESVVDDLELAYLASTAEPPKTLAILPIVRASLFRASDRQDSPWIPLQTFLWASDPAYVRFVDMRFEDAQTDAEQGDKADDLAAVVAQIAKEENGISPFDGFVESLEKTLENSKYNRDVSTAFLDAARAYRDVGAPDRAARFNDAMTRFTDGLRNIAFFTEEKRAALAEREIEDPGARAEFLAKTCYDVPRGLKAELYYYKFNAFFWNWVACLAALACFALSYARQFLRGTVRKDAAFNERFFFTAGLLFLAASCAAAFLGGALRAYITGWAPVANMFETVVLLAFLIAAIAIGYALAPAWAKPYACAWRSTAFPYKVADPEEKKIARAMLAPRLLLIAGCFWLAYRVWRAGQPADADVLPALARTARDAFAMKGALDSFAVLLTFLFVVWSVPRFIVTVAALVIFPKTTRRELYASESGEPRPRKEVVAQIGTEIVQRKAFITASSAVALAVAASAYFNSVEFNPNIRPLVAVLRSNFWLTIHVLAIIVSYALGAIAWVVALTSLASYIFGRYGVRVPIPGARPVQERPARDARRDRERGKGNAAERDRDRAPFVYEFEPEYARKTAPVIATMTRSAVLFLLAGIILGARWADFSWGRFWSWDPKEVWALVTLLIYLVVLHVNKISGGKRFVMALGANFGALAIIMTWYGLSFVMGGGGRHAYASGESNKIAVLYILFAVNIGWACLAIARYWFERARRRKRF